MIRTHLEGSSICSPTPNLVCNQQPPWQDTEALWRHRNSCGPSGISAGGWDKYIPALIRCFIRISVGLGRYILHLIVTNEGCPHSKVNFKPGGELPGGVVGIFNSP